MLFFILNGLSVIKGIKITLVNQIKRNTLEKKHYHVVAAAVIFEGCILCMQKGATPYIYTSHHYEFPGGKVEAGETEAAALQRELREEMNYKVQPIRHLLTVEHEYPDFSITLSAWLCTTASSRFTLKEHESFLWLPANKLSELDWCAADLPVASYITQLQHIESTNRLKTKRILFFSFFVGSTDFSVLRWR